MLFRFTYYDDNFSPFEFRFDMWPIYSYICAIMPYIKEHRCSLEVWYRLIPWAVINTLSVASASRVMLVKVLISLGMVKFLQWATCNLTICYVVFVMHYKLTHSHFMNFFAYYKSLVLVSPWELSIAESMLTYHLQSVDSCSIHMKALSQKELNFLVPKISSWITGILLFY